mgnify:CR=1 FL=1
MKTLYGYKLFEENSKGELFPLFIGKNTPTPINKWIPAEFIPTKGFASRGGWHIGELPDAPWLKGYDGTNLGCYKSRWKTGKRVWCLVEYNATNDYNSVVENLPKKCFTDRVPENGYYFFREVGKGVWSITSDIKVVRKISEQERQEILLKAGYNEKEAYAKYKQAFEKRMEKTA